MLDKNGNEIKVGDVVKCTAGPFGTVSEVSEDHYSCNDWSDHLGNGHRFVVSEDVTIIKSSKPISLSLLKAQAKLEIEALIKKHTSIINQAGGNLGMHVGFHDVRTIGSEQPSQLVDVVVTVTI